MTPAQQAAQDERTEDDRRNGSYQATQNTTAPLSGFMTRLMAQELPIMDSTSRQRVYDILREYDGTIRIGTVKPIPICISSVADLNNYQPVPYEEGCDGYNRVMEKLNGTYSGPNVTPGYNYSKE